ncbi:MAG: uroporphyrinogen decarboxylase family protein [Isosphaeraceae bacterium]
MATSIFLDLARHGVRFPFATDLVLNQEPDPEAARSDGGRLARVVERHARRWDCPLAFPLMDLRLEKADLLSTLGIDEEAADRFHFPGPIDEADRERLAHGEVKLCPASEARDHALEDIAARTDLLPIGMTIGPFSLATKLIADPITAAALMGSGVSAAEDPQVRLLEDCLEAAESVVAASVRRQLGRGARAMLVCEPTASTAYLSPRQLKAGATTFERLVMEPNTRIARLLRESGADLIFHDCGELTADMIRAFATRLAPAVLSLGSSRKLWEDAALVPETVVLYGNLPTKSFYSDAVMPVEEVRRRSEELAAAMRGRGHPHILGSECDVLHVPDAAGTIWAKVEAMMSAGPAGVASR